MRIDPADLIGSIGALGDLEPEASLGKVLQQVVDAAKLLFRTDGAGLMLADANGDLRWATASDQRIQTVEDNQEVLAQGPCMEAFAQRTPMAMRDARQERHWGEITLVYADLDVQAALSVPVELGGGPIGTLDVYSVTPRDWDPSEVSAAQAYAGVVATVLGAAARAEAKGRLARQLQAALDHRVLIEQAKGALMAREDVDEATAFDWLRTTARSSERKVADVARDVLAGRWQAAPGLAEAIRRAVWARQLELRAHERAAELHEQAAELHDQLDREERARDERERAALARKRLHDAQAEAGGQ